MSSITIFVLVIFGLFILTQIFERIIKFLEQTNTRMIQESIRKQKTQKSLGIEKSKIQIPISQQQLAITSIHVDATIDSLQDYQIYTLPELSLKCHNFLYRIALLDHIVVKQYTEYADWLYKRDLSTMPSKPTKPYPPFIDMSDVATHLSVMTIQRFQVLISIAPSSIPKTKFVFITPKQESDVYYFTIIQEKIIGVTLWDFFLRYTNCHLIDHKLS